MFHRSKKIQHFFAMLRMNKQEQSKTENLGNIKPNTPIRKSGQNKKMQTVNIRSYSGKGTR
jgi:hypothetical protein